jgi:septal ring factor EnvC (AmiA/AmiB activator)
LGDEVQEPDRQITVFKTRRNGPPPGKSRPCAGLTLASVVTFLYRTRPLKNAWKIKMLEASLSQLEQLVSDLVQQNQSLAQTNQTLSTELAQAKDENESLQLNLMEQEEKHGATAARIQALVDRVNAGPVSA